MLQRVSMCESMHRAEYACCVFRAKAAVMRYNAVLARAAHGLWAHYTFGVELTCGGCALLLPKAFVVPGFSCTARYRVERPTEGQSCALTLGLTYFVYVTINCCVLQKLIENFL